MGRTCGDCTACCTVMRVEELDKPQWTPCDQLTHPSDDDPVAPNDWSDAPAAVDARQRDSRRGGCAIYDQRPDSCRAFSCLWLKGLILSSDDDRPDRVGIVLVPSESSHRAIGAFEVWPHAADAEHGRLLIDRLRAAGLNIVVGNPTGMRRLTPLTVDRRPTVHVDRVAPTAPLKATPTATTEKKTRNQYTGDAAQGPNQASRLVAASLRNRAGSA
jgi:hypothetical protein